MGTRAALTLSLALASVSCRPTEDEQTASSSAAPPAETFTPLTQSPGQLVSNDGRIAVPIPTGEGWECVEERHGQADASAVALRCRREDPREFLFFAAKHHRQPRDQRTDAETLLMTMYRSDNEDFFDRVEYTRSGPAELAGAQGWEAELIAEHARLGTIRKRERVAIVGDRVFAISAEGLPSLWATHAAEIERWFAELEFAG